MAQQITFDDTLYLKGEELVLDNGTSDGVIKSKNGTLKIDGAALITGDLTVSGTTTTVNSTTLTIDDKNIELGSIGSPTDTTADGGGITLKGATDKTILWIDSTDTWDFNQKVKSINGFEGNLTGNSTGLHFGGLDTQGQDLLSTGLSELNDVRIWSGSINATTIGAVTPSTGTFSTITGDGANITNVLSNYTTTNLTEGTNKYFTDARIDAHLNQSNPNPGYVLSWNGTDYVWGPTSLANHSIDALNDVDTTTVAPTTGQTIIWNGTNFVPGESFSQADFNTAFTAKDTDDLSEGTTNLYYTDARAEAVSINNLVEDTTPQLGGTLDLNTFDITTTDNFATLTTSKSSGSTSTIVASTESNLSNTTVTVNDDGDYANSVSSFVTLTSTQIDTLGFKGDSSLTYFGAAAPTSNFVFVDTGDNVEQNSMVVVYHTPTDTYTFTLASQHADNDAGQPGNQNQLNISAADADIKFKQYAYGEMTVTSATALTTSNTQFKDSGGFDIDSDDVTITNTGGTNYKIVFWTHDVSVGDVITVIHPPEGNTIFGWGGITTTGGRLTLLDTSGNLIYKFPAADGTSNQVLTTNGAGDLSWSTPTITLSTLKSVVAASTDFADFQSRIAAL